MQLFLLYYCCYLLLTCDVEKPNVVICLDLMFLFQIFREDIAMVIYLVQGLGIYLAHGSDLQKVITYLMKLSKMKVDYLSSISMFKNKIDTYLKRAGYT